MKAVVFHHHGGPEMLEVVDVPTPEPGPGQVRVAVRAVGLNHLDLWVRRGIPGLSLPLPHVGGSEVSGVVESVGDGVDGRLVGDEVIVNPSLPCGRCHQCRLGETSRCDDYAVLGEHVHGGAAEYVVVNADRLYPKPSHLNFEEAAAVPLVFQTAWRALITRARVRPGENVLIVGASGGVATAAIQIAALAGARVIAVTSSADKASKIADLGADVVIDRSAEPWSKTAWLATGRRGADVVVDSVGAATWSDSIRSAASGGRIVTYGATTGAIAETDLRYVFWRQLNILGTTMATDGEFDDVMNLVAQGTLRPVVEQVLGLYELRTAHEILEAGSVVGKIVLRVAGDEAA
jgi:NADPH:quinone reductase-like Zn-dependent oxidoreductase